MVTKRDLKGLEIMPTVWGIDVVKSICGKFFLLDGKYLHTKGFSSYKEAEHYAYVIYNSSY